MHIKRLYPNGIGDGTLILFPNDPLYAFALIHPKNAANQPISTDCKIPEQVTEDIDYEIVEPPKLPPSNTIDE